MVQIKKHSFGRTGHDSSVVLFGGAALWSADQETANRVLDLLLEFGVNHIDTAASYGDAELRIGPWMARHRVDFFLATKTGKRSYSEARDEFRRSLDLLRTDHVDLLQIHALTHPDDWDQVFSEDGALRAVVEARDEGLTRFIGVTGHGWNIAAMHRRSLAAFDFDSVLMPWNWVCANNPDYRRDFEAVLGICRERNLAVQAIKAIARGPWAAGATKTRNTWYQPLEAEEDIRLAVHWLLAQPGLFLNSVGDIDLLPAVLRAAAGEIEMPDAAAMEAHSERTGMTSIFGI